MSAPDGMRKKTQKKPAAAPGAVQVGTDGSRGNVADHGHTSSAVVPPTTQQKGLRRTAEEFDEKWASRIRVSSPNGTTQATPIMRGLHPPRETMQLSAPATMDQAYDEIDNNKYPNPEVVDGSNADLMPAEEENDEESKQEVDDNRYPIPSPSTQGADISMIPRPFTLSVQPNVPIEFNNGIDNTGLAIAREVEDASDADLMQAEEVDPADLERKRAATKNKMNNFIASGLLVMIIVVVAAVLGVAFGLSSKDTTATPTRIPSLPPTDMPSSEPSSVLAVLLQALPHYTLESINLYATPQWNAREWLLGHPQLPVMPEWRKKQLFALATIFHAMEGPHWPKFIREDWMLYEKSECYWFSSEFGGFADGLTGWTESSTFNITPCNDRGEFQFLALYQLDLARYQPHIPPEISFLTSLFRMVLPGNGINSSLTELLPSQIYQMSNLVHLSLQSNLLSGEIPSQFGLMTNMVDLVLFENALRGPIPTELGSITSMTLLYLYSNGLSGEIPSQFGLMTNMVGLDLSENALRGPIPTELGSMTSMTDLTLFTNGLSGEIPSQFGLMTNMVELELYDNALNGPIPTELGSMTSMSLLYLNSKGLFGEIPSQLGLMTNMVELVLFENALRGPIPTELGSMTSMTKLYLYSNGLSGEIPSQFGLMTNMVELELYDNALNGPIPTELGSMTSMTDLYLDSNGLSGEIPSQFGLMTNMVDLELHDNALNGPIPTELGSMINVAYLYLYSNGLSGEIPSQFGLMTKMKSLLLKNNSLTGTIPAALDFLAVNGSLIIAKFANNTLLGTVPAGLCSTGLWSDIIKMGLSFDCGNQLCGCCWCPCPGSSTRVDCQTQPFLDESWPGSFPVPLNITNVVIINLFSDDFPEDTTFEWSKQEAPDFWEISVLHDPKENRTLHSYTMEVVSNATYRLQVFDSYGDGTCCGVRGRGWLTITNSTPSDDHSDGTVLWEALGDFESLLEVLLWIDPHGHAQQVEDVP